MHNMTLVFFDKKGPIVSNLSLAFVAGLHLDHNKHVFPVLTLLLLDVFVFTFIIIISVILIIIVTLFLAYISSGEHGHLKPVHCFLA